MRRVSPTSPPLLMGAALLALCGCSNIRHIIHPQDTAQKRADQIQLLQLKNMRFADEYVGSIVAPIRQYQSSTDNPQDRLVAQNWMLSQATAAYTIASSPSPTVNAVDLAVLATLSSMVIDDAWSSERFGERAATLRDTYHRLQPRSMNLLNGVLTPEQITALQQAIVEWRAQNPHTTAISFIHFRDVAASTKGSAGGGDSFSGLFSLLGLDPFSSLDPAVHEITQTRELAERTIYYAQRMPNLLDMQVERLTFEFAAMPETKRMLADADQVSGAANMTGRVIGDLPNLLTREREAAIKQFMDAITVETAQTRQLVTDLRSALETGTQTSNSLNTTIQSFDQLVARLDKPTSSAGSAQKPGRPFDITEYTAAAAQIARAAGDLQQLIAGIDQGTPALARAAEQGSASLREVVDHAYWRAMQLIAVLLLGGLAAALTYRGVSRRWR
jgi:hypothetical protein